MQAGDPDSRVAAAPPRWRVRRPDWRGRLFAYVEAERAAPYEYGRHDCALFAAGVIAAMTGFDVGEGFRGQYRSAFAGLRLLRRALGARAPAAVLAAMLDEIPRHRAAYGDLALVGPAARPNAIALVAGHVLLVRTPAGLGTMPLGAARTVWRI